MRICLFPFGLRFCLKIDNIINRYQFSNMFQENYKNVSWNSRNAIYDNVAHLKGRTRTWARQKKNNDVFSL